MTFYASSRNYAEQSRAKSTQEGSSFGLRSAACAGCEMCREAKRKREDGQEAPAHE